MCAKIRLMSNGDKTMTSPQYEAAITAHNDALRIFTLVQTAYRAMTATDDEFLAARAAMDLADLAFDIAFAIEERRPEPTYELDPDDQLNLLD
jgi:hypothetical protein